VQSSKVDHYNTEATMLFVVVKVDRSVDLWMVDLQVQRDDYFKFLDL
jgi:hypothetical protein